MSNYTYYYRALPEEVNHLGGGSTEAGSVLVDLADESLLAVKIGGVELPPGLLTNAQPVEDGELLPVNCVGVERPVMLPPTCVAVRVLYRNYVWGWDIRLGVKSVVHG